jgi:hypothetical protein
VELIPAGPDDEDVGAISSRFFLLKGKSKTIQFHPNKVLELYLELVRGLPVHFHSSLRPLAFPTTPEPFRSFEVLSGDRPEFPESSDIVQSS